MSDIRTPRLLLRSWREADLPAYAALNADAEVRRWFPGTLTRDEDSDAQAARFQGEIAAHGFGFWAVEVPGITPFIGFVGLRHVTFPAPFTPAVEAGWRLAREHWGRGYATEAARVALAHGFGPLALPEIVAFAVPGNLASRRVMERIGMTRDPADDFDHPGISEGSPLRRHVLYRAARMGWDDLAAVRPPSRGCRPRPTGSEAVRACAFAGAGPDSAGWAATRGAKEAFRLSTSVQARR